MKIKCTLQEYTRMIRMCQYSKEDSECRGCVMADICGENIIEDAVEFELEREERERS